MIKYLIAVYRWMTSDTTLRNAIFVVRIAKTLIKDDKYREKLDIAQEILDNAQEITSNKDTKAVSDGINNSRDEKTWGDFEAVIVKDKHGKGNNGIDLGYSKDVSGIPINIGYDPSDGSASIGIGPLRFGG